jgi:ribosome-associated protein
VIDVPVASGGIRLGQFLKLAAAVDSGADVKALVGEEMVRVNDAVETRRGRQLVTGDVIRVADQSFRVA